MRHLTIVWLCAVVGALAWPSAAEANDAVIAKQLSERLREAKAEGDLKGFRIGVKVEDGVVWLSGHVHDDAQRESALRMARGVPGVRLVVNDVVTGGATGPPNAIAEPVVQERSGSENEATPKSTAQQVRQVDAVRLKATTEAAGRAEAADAQTPKAITPLEDRSVVSAATAISYGNLPQPAMMNMAYVAVAPTSGGMVAIPAGMAPMPSFVHVVPAIMPVPAAAGSAAEGQNPNTQAAKPAPKPVPLATAKSTRLVNYYSEPAADCYEGGPVGVPVPEYGGSGYGGMGGSMYENPQMPPYAWPSYASYPNYAAVAYPQQYSASAWPYIGPFYPYPQVPLGWRKVCLEWDDGWWMLDFKAK